MFESAWWWSWWGNWNSDDDDDDEGFCARYTGSSRAVSHMTAFIALRYSPQLTRANKPLYISSRGQIVLKCLATCYPDGGLSIRSEGDIMASSSGSCTASFYVQLSDRVSWEPSYVASRVIGTDFICSEIRINERTHTHTHTHTPAHTHIHTHTLILCLTDTITDISCIFAQYAHV